MKKYDEYCAELESERSRSADYRRRWIESNESLLAAGMHVKRLEERIKRLEEAGDALANNHNPFTFIDWQKAKESK